MYGSEMKYVGAHVSTQGGVANAPMRAHEIGARSFALFTGWSSRWNSPTPKPEEVELFRSRCEEYGYIPELILPHGNFLINLGSPDSEKLNKSRNSFVNELKRCAVLGLTMLNFHPGSHLNGFEHPDNCLNLIAESINLALDKTDSVMAVLENTAGQGSNLGNEFEHLAHIIDKVEDKSRIGVCIDTAHAYSAGYDFGTPDGYEQVWKTFDDIIGFKYLRGMHINDDARALGSRIDRHASLGKGTLGTQFFRLLMNDSRLDNIPLILETPEPEIWQEEIELLYSMVESC